MNLLTESSDPELDGEGESKLAVWKEVKVGILTVRELSGNGLGCGATTKSGLETRI